MDLEWIWPLRSLFFPYCLQVDVPLEEWEISTSAPLPYLAWGWFLPGYTCYLLSCAWHFISGWYLGQQTVPICMWASSFSWSSLTCCRWPDGSDANNHLPRTSKREEPEPRSLQKKPSISFVQSYNSPVQNPGTWQPRAGWRHILRVQCHEKLRNIN